MIVAIFTKDYRPNLSETFGNVLKSFGDHSVIYEIPAYVFWPEISFNCTFKITNITVFNNLVGCQIFTFKSLRKQSECSGKIFSIRVWRAGLTCVSSHFFHFVESISPHTTGARTIIKIIPDNTSGQI